MVIDYISVVILAKNSDKTIKECLENLKNFNEVILYLNNSTDTTEEIAKNFSNVKIVKGNFIGFGPTKNEAASYASCDWILSLDSDEILNKELIDDIGEQDFTNINSIFVLKIRNYFLGYKTIITDLRMRLYNKNSTKFNDSLVHEKIIVDKRHKKVVIKSSLKHLNITDINQTLTKMVRYTDLGAKDKKTCFFIVVIAKSFFAFIQSYFLRFYFLDGWVGFTISITNANRRFYKYLKQFLNCKKL